jgi:ParB-like nuclease family protein
MKGQMPNGMRKITREVSRGTRGSLDLVVAATRRVKRQNNSIKIGHLPHSQSLALPEPPTPEQMARFGRIESVPLSQARATQNTMKGGYSGDLIKGYGDKPVAARRKDGEYLIFDGHHRTVAAINEGKDTLPMYVIDVKDYAPQFAGRAPAPDKTSAEDLLKELGL